MYQMLCLQYFLCKCTFVTNIEHLLLGHKENLKTFPYVDTVQIKFWPQCSKSQNYIQLLKKIEIFKNNILWHNFLDAEEIKIKMKFAKNAGEEARLAERVWHI